MKLTSCNRAEAKAVDTFKNLDENSSAVSCVLLVNLLLFRDANKTQRQKKPKSNGVFHTLCSSRQMPTRLSQILNSN